MTRRHVVDPRRRLLVRLLAAGAVLATAVAVVLASPVPSGQPAAANGVNYGCGGASSAVFSSGAGTGGDPYIVTNSAQLAAVSASAQNLAAHYLQQCDIDLSTVANWPGIGGGTNDYTGTTASYDPFEGVYDGNGKTISNLSVSVSAGHGHGLFRNVVGATVKNVNLNGVTIAASAGKLFNGSLIGHAIDSTVSGVTATDVNVSATLSGYSSLYIGGLVGMGQARGSSSMSLIDVTVAGVVTTSSRASYVGGLVGELFTASPAANSQLVVGNAHTAVDIQAASYVGGLVGSIVSSTDFASTTVSGSSASGSLDVSETAGGLIGAISFTGGQVSGSTATMTIIDVTSSAQVVASSWAAGGLIGSINIADASTLRLDRAHSAGDVMATYDSVGGMIGYVSGQRLGPVLSIDHSTVTGAITGASHSVGGVIGRAQASVSDLTDFTVVIANTTASGPVTGGTGVGNVDGVGGFVGRLRVDGPARPSNISLTVLDSMAASPVTGQSRVGGVVGLIFASNGTTRLSVGSTAATGPVTALGAEAGGVVGSGGGHVTLSAVTRSGAVSVSADTGYAAGGFVGYNSVDSLLIENSTSSSDVTGKFEIGGAVGYMDDGAVLSAVSLSGDVSGETDIGCYVGTALDENEPLLTRQGSTTATGTKTILGVSTPCPGGSSGSSGSSGVVLPPPIMSLTVPTSTVPSSTVPSTRPPVTSSTVPAPVPTGGVLPLLVPGASQVFEDGVPADVEVFVDNSTDLVLRGQDFELRLAGDCASGCTIETTADGREVLTLEQRGLAKVTGEGFLAGTPVYVWLFSEPRFLGELTVNADGSFTGNVPLGDIAPGEHTLQVNGTSFDGLPRTANLGVMVIPSQVPTPDPGVLPATGTDSTPLWLVALVLLGAGLVATGRRRVAT